MRDYGNPTEPRKTERQSADLDVAEARINQVGAKVDNLFLDVGREFVRNQVEPLAGLRFDRGEEPDPSAGLRQRILRYAASPGQSSGVRWQSQQTQPLAIMGTNVIVNRSG